MLGVGVLRYYQARRQEKALARMQAAALAQEGVQAQAQAPPPHSQPMTAEHDRPPQQLDVAPKTAPQPSSRPEVRLSVLGGDGGRQGAEKGEGHQGFAWGTMLRHMHVGWVVVRRRWLASKCGSGWKSALWQGTQSERVDAGRVGDCVGLSA